MAEGLHEERLAVLGYGFAPFPCVSRGSYPERMVGRRVLLVDDHAAFRESAGAWLVREGFVVVGASGSGIDLQATIEAVHPDIVLLDVNLPGLSGPEVAALLPRAAGAPEVILISSDDEAASDPRVLEAPVAGFLAKRDLSCAAIDALLC